jgi:hypothetical protein
MRPLARGLLAGAFGTLLLNAATYVDMAVTGRPASKAPEETVRRTAGALGLDPPSDDARLEAYGALGGLSTGLGIGVVASLTRAAGVRLPAPLGALAIGGAAMAATDTQMGVLGVSDPRQWTPEDWARDVLPHVAYGVGTRWAMDAIDRRPTVGVPSLSGTRVLARSLWLGVATGVRNSLALGGPVVATRGTGASLAAAGLVVGELLVDKVPGVPARTQPGPLALRMLGGSAGSVALARHHDASGTVTTLAGLVGAAGAGVGAVAGVVWRDLAADQGWTWPAGVAEDVVALGLTAAAWR